MKITEVHARAIEDWLKSSGYSQRAAAKVLGVSNTAIHKWLTPGAGLHRTQWNKLLTHIEPFLPQSDGWESTHRLIDKISQSQNSGLKKVYIDNFLKSFTEINQRRELLGKVELSDFSDLVNSSEDVTHIVLPYRSLDKPEAFLWTGKQCAYTTFVTNEKGEDHLNPYDIKALKEIIYKMIKIGSNPYRTIFWRVQDDEESIRIFRCDKALPTQIIPHVYGIAPDSRDIKVFEFWESLIEEVFKEHREEFLTFREKMMSYFQKPKEYIKLHRDFLKDAGATAGKIKPFL
ncbi:hypothetical protein PQO01_07140 [Lentisphaera marina]|uniref:hypothetical protein n=1 Tax=Lentisphaera marina TaxID=1111041 RepID=UPI0023653C0E|nr:hypothetical protein [Lentisphaera marina]MDD7984722.1 hypothetical protein [Lentisphaera marina]